MQKKDYDLVVDEDQINFVMAEQIPGTKDKQVRYTCRAVQFFLS